MNKYLRPVPLALFSLILLAGLGYIYWKSQAFSVSTQSKVTDNLRLLEQLDSQWNLDVWRTKDGMTNRYEKLTSPQEKVLALQSELSSDLSNMGHADLSKKANELTQLITKKADLIESFSSQSVVLQNSLKFIPTATFELQQLIAEDKFKNPTHAKTLTALNELADNLLTETLKFNLAPSAEIKANIELGISFIESIQSTYSSEIGDQVEVLLSHARTILRQKERADALLKNITALNPSEQTRQIDNILNDSYSVQLQQQQNYRNYLVIYSSLLLLILAYVGYQLLKSAQAATQANNDLNKANSSLVAANQWLDEMIKVRDEMVTFATDELKESQVQMVQSEKMASIGQMVAGVTHEINTPLAYVKSGLEISRTRINDIAELINECMVLNTLLQSGEADEESLANQLQRISEISTTLSQEDMANELDGLLKDGLHGINQISEIVLELKNFSRVDRAKLAEFNINEGLESTLKIANNIVKHKKIIKRYGDIPTITCSASSINQIFLNLISNAAQATGENGEITLITTTQEQFVKIAIIDNGSGIPADVIDKIFEPFFTTKTIGEGTGLGLSIVKRIIREHGGEIKVQSKVGLGTKFTILLPLEMQPQATANELTFA